MILSFANQGTENIFDGLNSKSARKILDPSLHAIASRKLDMIDSAIDLNDLKIPPSNRLEALKEDLKGKFSIRINDQYRITFIWKMQGAEYVEIIDYH